MSTYHHGDLRTALLQGAGKALEKQGVAALSMRAAARRAGVSHNAPYRHFTDREGLLAALAAEGFGMLGEALRGKEGRALGEAYVRFALGNPQRFRLMFGGVLPIARYPQLRESAGRAHQALVASLKELPDPQTAAAAAWSLVHGLAQLLLDGHFPSHAAQREAFVARVLGAVRFTQRAA